jgi:hypothetical protein
MKFQIFVFVIIAVFASVFADNCDFHCDDVADQVCYRNMQTGKLQKFYNPCFAKEENCIEKGDDDKGKLMKIMENTC